MKIAVKNFRAFQKGALQGYLDIDLGEPNWTIKGCTLFNSNGRSWVNLPTRAYKDENGENKYAHIIEMTPEGFKDFSEKCLEAYKDFINNSSPSIKSPEAEIDLLDMPF